MSPKYASRMLAAVVCALALSACSDEAKKPEAPKMSASQAEIKKYNEYVSAANRAGDTYERALEKWENDLAPKFAGTKPLKDMYINDGSPHATPQIKESLDNALAMSPAIDDLDALARAYSEALGKFLPVSTDMNNYISAKTYVSDKGAHGKEIQAAYGDSLKAVVATQAAFFGGIEVKDRARTKAEFENAKKDTTEYFRAGLIYYSKESVNMADGLFEGTGLGDQLDPFSKALDDMNKMAVAYDGKLRESNQKGCPSLMSNVNSYLSAGRTAIEHTTGGRYDEEAKRTGIHARVITRSIETDANNLRRTYNSLVGALNRNSC
ncbi:YiiG family protein [Pseudomonadota bacterium AL_CKDN230030165-1A_HGKHYDSX7]